MYATRPMAGECTTRVPHHRSTWYDAPVKRVIMIVAAFVLVATTAAAQSASSRAWQQRMDVEIPLPVPLVELLPVNPFAIIVDETPKVLQASLPRKVAIRGAATVAAFVDAKGVCLGAVPLKLPVPGLTASLVEDLNGSRFDPATAGGAPQPSWVVLEIGMEGKVKESEIVDQTLEMPDLETPSVPNQPVIKVNAPGRDDEIHIRALIHVTENGRCDRYVPLELYDGLDPWFSGYLASWRMQPASRDGAPVAVWVEYSARVRMKISGISSTTSRVVRDREYTPDQ